MRNRKLLALLFVLSSASLSWGVIASNDEEGRGSAYRSLDLLVLNGKVVDGTGNPWRYADVGIADGVIVEIGRLSGRSATRVVDAAGMVVSPGFIDVHTHCDGGLGDDRSNSNWNYLRQGVTTVVTGNCGDGRFDLDRFKAELGVKGIGTHCAHLIGFGNVRGAVLGDDPRAPAASELEEMASLVRQGMLEGAWGMSTGLEYTPDTYASTDEVLAMARVVAEFGGVYASHQRNEFDGVYEATLETIHIGESTGIRVLTSHFKACGKDNWGSLRAAAGAIEAARARGVQAFADQYPYDKPSVEPMLSIRSNRGWSCFCVPHEMEPFAGLRKKRRSVSRSGNSSSEKAAIDREYVAELRASLADPVRREEIRTAVMVGSETDPSSVARAGWDSYGVVWSEQFPELMGRVLSDVAKERGTDGFTLAAELVVEEPGMILTSGVMSPSDLRFAMKKPWLMISSDGDAYSPRDAEVAPEVGHPRSFGSQARMLRKFVRDEGVVGLEEAVRKMTSLPAQFLGMTRRGVVMEGQAADLVVFNADKVVDTATFLDARRYCEGVEYVILEGNIAVDRGQPTKELHGQVLIASEER